MAHSSVCVGIKYPYYRNNDSPAANQIIRLEMVNNERGDNMCPLARQSVYDGGHENRFCNIEFLD